MFICMSILGDAFVGSAGNVHQEQQPDQEAYRVSLLVTLIHRLLLDLSRLEFK